MVRPIIGTSWKMHLTPSEARTYLETLRPHVADVTDRDLFVLPPFPSIYVAREVLTGSNVAWGAQDVHPTDWGAHTGDVSAPMLADLGARYVEVGHSERRRDHGETPALIAAKVAAAMRWGLVPVLCVGEVRRMDPDSALALLLPDLAESLSRVDPTSFADLIVAYEPVWAIGEGAAPAAPTEVGVVHRGIHAWLADKSPAGCEGRVIYGGSVNESVAGSLLAEPGIDGLFVGRRALDPLAFAEIARTPIQKPAH